MSNRIDADPEPEASSLAAPIITGLLAGIWLIAALSGGGEAGYSVASFVGLLLVSVPLLASVAILEGLADHANRKARRRLLQPAGALFGQPGGSPAPRQRFEGPAADPIGRTSDRTDAGRSAA
jgi:hypothetical protein